MELASGWMKCLVNCQSFDSLETSPGAPWSRAAVTYSPPTDSRGPPFAGLMESCFAARDVPKALICGGRI